MQALDHESLRTTCNGCQGLQGTSQGNNEHYHRQHCITNALNGTDDSSAWKCKDPKVCPLKSNQKQSNSQNSSPNCRPCLLYSVFKSRLRIYFLRGALPPPTPTFSCQSKLQKNHLELCLKCICLVFTVELKNQTMVASCGGVGEVEGGEGKGGENSSAF